MTSNITPGPWKFGVRDDGSIWLSIGDPMKGPHFQADLCASVADAQLIVSAPDLLEALQKCLPLLHMNFSSTDKDAAFAQAREAITKAKAGSA